jgi:hypothetical protein
MLFIPDTARLKFRLLMINCSCESDKPLSRARSRYPVHFFISAGIMLKQKLFQHNVHTDKCLRIIALLELCHIWEPTP